jgi:hypothetical protein
MSTTPEAPSDRIRVDTLPYTFIADIQQKFRENLYNPNQNPDATTALIALRNSWADLGVTTVYTTGVFDMLHMDHSGYLLHTKAVGAATHYDKNVERGGWEHLTPDEQQCYTVWALGNGVLKLIVSVDGDISVDARKGDKVDKGGVPRPVYSWQTRALSVASQSYVNPTRSNTLLPTVDAVTVHGPLDFAVESRHHTTFTVAEALQPDTWAIFGESLDILETAPQIPGLGTVALHCIQDGEGIHYHEDDFVGKMSTTNIIRRLTGQK